MRNLSKPLAPTFGEPVRKSTNANKGTSSRVSKNRATTFSSPGGGSPATKTTKITRIKKNKQGTYFVEKEKTKGISQKRFRKASDRIAVGEARQAFKNKKKSIKK